MHDRRLEAAADYFEQSLTAVGKREELGDVTRRRYRATTGSGDCLGARRRAELVRCNQDACDLVSFVVVQR